MKVLCTIVIKWLLVCNFIQFLKQCEMDVGSTLAEIKATLREMTLQNGWGWEITQKPWSLMVVVDLLRTLGLLARKLRR